jgi:Ca-activated chloride channel family protein
MLIDGEPIEATIYSAEEARRIYDDIVRQLRDPALLEYVGRGLVQASVFPIQPGQERTIQITYREVLTAEQGLIRYSHPLDVSSFSAQPIEQVSVRVAVTSAEPIRAVYSSSHQVAFDRPDDFHVTAGWEGSNVLPTTDFDLIYTVSQDQIGANLLSYVDPATGEGYFMLLAAPGVTAPTTAVAKDVVVVFDTSGSMEGEKFAQAQQALVYVLEHLNPEDRFAIGRVQHRRPPLRDELMPQLRRPERGQLGQGPSGHRRHRHPPRPCSRGWPSSSPSAPTYLMFLTDGLPTEGEVQSPVILSNVESATPGQRPASSPSAVGDDVDALPARQPGRGPRRRQQLRPPGERIDEVVSAFYAKVSTPS